jgi:alpha-tubulin suppressor-like RCC1 family protein
MNTPDALPALLNISSIAAGSWHTCALTAVGGVKCWGRNRDGQLGDGTIIDRLTPVNVSGLTSGVSAITAGGSHTCALTEGGMVKCWGASAFVQLGNDTTTQHLTPISVSGLASGVRAITAGIDYTCALFTGGGVKCWGLNWDGQLGDGTTTDRLTPVSVSGLESGVRAIATGGTHNCALIVGGRVKCWGNNERGQLGDGTTTQHLTPVSVSGLASRASAITTGLAHTCALTSAGGVKCWGFNDDGQLGDDTTTFSSTPMDVSGLVSGVSAITAGWGHTCARTSGGGVKCWGNNDRGQLGDGTTTQHLTPVSVSGLANGVSAIAAGYNHTCALTAEGGVKCWGGNASGQLGDSTDTDRLTPISVNGLASGDIAIDAIDAGAWHTCALSASGGVKCWGANASGQQGDGTTTTRLTPVPVSGLASRVGAISTGFRHSCALTVGRRVMCWGYNESGQLGDGTTTGRLKPVSVSGLVRGWGSAISTGYAHTCVIWDGINCWGANESGQLGDGTTINRLTPLSSSELEIYHRAITTGYAHTCELTERGGVYCWGGNWYGQLGDGTTSGHLTPLNVSDLVSGVRAITSGYAHTCALTDGGGVLCWGANDYGQLGDGTTTNRLTPVSVNGLASGVLAIAANSFHTCALTAGSGVKCWGANQDGQLGDGTTKVRLTPVSVSGLVSGVDAITTGFWHTCALIAGGEVMCWGFNGDGELGDGTTTDRLTPVSVIGLVS